MRKSPIDLTGDARAILEREAQLRAPSKTNKQLAREIGAGRTFVQEHLARRVRQIRIEKCSTLGSGPLEPEEK